MPFTFRRHETRVMSNKKVTCQETVTFSVVVATVVVSLCLRLFPDEESTIACTA